MARVQLVCDGIPVEKVKGRLAGTIELEEEDIRRSGLDDVGVAVVVYRVKTPTFKVNRHGELERTNVYGVSELRLLDDELRDEMIRRCGLFMEETLFSSAASVVPPPVASAPPEGVDPDTGEVSAPDPEAEPEEPLSDDDDFTDVPPLEGGEDGEADIVQRVVPEPRPGATAQPAAGGPKVAKFNPDDDDDGSDDRTVVGQVRQGPRKDKSLERFLQEV